MKKTMKQKPNLPDDIDYPPRTIDWYEKWRSSSITDNWSQPQWEFMFDTALVHANVWGSGNFAMLGALGKREVQMGLVFEPQKVEIDRLNSPLAKIKKKNKVNIEKGEEMACKTKKNTNPSKKASKSTNAKSSKKSK